MTPTFWAMVLGEVKGPFTYEQLIGLEAGRELSGVSLVKSTFAHSEGWTTWGALKPEAMAALTQARVQAALRATSGPQPPTLPTETAQATFSPLVSAPMARPVAHFDDEKPPLSRAVYIVLALFLGSLGIHNFYAGRVGQGYPQAILSIIAFVCFYNDNSGAFILFAGIVGIWILLNIVTTDKDADGRWMR